MTEGEEVEHGDAHLSELMQRLFLGPPKDDANESATGNTNDDGNLLVQQSPGGNTLIRHALQHQWNRRSVQFVVFLHEISERPWEEYSNPDDVVGILHEAVSRSYFRWHRHSSDFLLG